MKTEKYINETIKTIRKQVKKFYPKLNLTDVEFEYEEDGEYYFNVYDEDYDYPVKSNPKSGLIYWSVYFSKFK